MSAMSFQASTASVRDSLLEGGIIRLVKSERTKDNKWNHWFELTGKDLSTLQIKINEQKWEDGTPKSKGNAFDLSTAKGLFSKSELAAVYNKGKPTNYNTPVKVIAYSKA